MNNNCLWGDKGRQFACKLCGITNCEHRLVEFNPALAIENATIPAPRKRDEIDDWLEKECNYRMGCCSSIEELKYNVAREVAEKLWKKK